MRLALPVYRPLSAEVLLREGFSLDRPTIGRLRELRVPEIWIEYPGAERIRSLVSPQVLRLRAELAGHMSDLFDRVQNQAGAKLEYHTYRQTIASILDELLADPDAAVHLSELAGAGESQARHAAAVCLLSLLLGLRLQGYLIRQRPRLLAHHARNTLNLGIGAMLHDIGLARLPEAAVRFERDRDESDPEWRTHPRLGYEMISGTVDATAAVIVLDHHQRWDGGGFPVHRGTGRPRRGREIHVFARIAAVADAYDRELHRPDGSRWPRVRVMRSLLAGALRHRFDPVVLAVLPVVAPPYPPGSEITLDNGQRAVVLDWDPGAPCRPTVTPVVAADHDGPPPVPIDLREVCDRVIVEQEGHDVADDNFEYTYGKALLEGLSEAEAA